MRIVHGYGWLLVFALAASAAGVSHAQDFPNKPIRFQTSTLGGGTDTVARLIAAELGPLIGQQVIVENRPGGNILATGVAKSPPDGYTLLVTGSTMWITTLFEKVPYDPVRDFAPVAALARTPFLLVVHPSLPVKSTVDLVKLAKARPGQLNYSSGPTGGTPHLAAELLKSMSGVDIVRIAYKSGSQEVADLLTGMVHMTFGVAAAWNAHIKAGKMRVIAATSPERASLFPDVPTVGEAFPGYVAVATNAMFAPARTPDAVVQRLNQEIARVLAKSEVRQRLSSGGQDAAGGSPEQLSDAVKSEMVRVAKLIKDVGISTDR